MLIYFWRNTLQSMKENLPMTVFYFAMIGITAVGSSDSARCQVYLFIPVLFFYCRVLEFNLDFFRTWQNMFFIVVIQVFNSNLFNMNAALYSDYMPHYMSPETGRSIFYMFMISFTIVVILRVIFLKKRWLFIKNWVIHFKGNFKSRFIQNIIPINENTSHICPPVLTMARLRSSSPTPFRSRTLSRDRCHRSLKKIWWT